LNGALLHDPPDRTLLAAAAVQGLVMAGALGAAAAAAPWPLRLALAAAHAFGVCWASNTVSHLHLHRPLFRAPAANAALSLMLTLTCGVPQRLWRRRHLAHHGLPGPEGALWPELLALLSLLGVLAVARPGALLAFWLPATGAGLALCALSGWAEHRGQSPGVDHRHPLYNRLWFNDGFHAAHHRHPELHWTALPAAALPADDSSRWPPLLRWMEPLCRGGNTLQAAALDALERAALAHPAVQRLLLRSHRPALAALVGALPAPPRRVVIVGGGLFPRSALLLAELLPAARILIVDASGASLRAAARFLPAALRPRVQLVAAHFDPAVFVPCDLLVIPLAFRGDRARLYRAPPAAAVLVHDWLWRGHGQASAIIPLLAKRLHLVRAITFPTPANTGNLRTACCRPSSSSAFARATTTLS
jgi:hypothetical protein